MFAKICASSLLVSALCLQVAAHAAVSPALGVKGVPVRRDVQRPSAAKPCGNVDIASNIGTSTAAQADGNGIFNATMISFNGGKDGSRQVTAKVDPTGTGTKFQEVKILKNGNGNPAAAGSDVIEGQLPEGINCKGKCLVAVVTSAGFGNCMVVEQQAAVQGKGKGKKRKGKGNGHPVVVADSASSNANAGGNNNAGNSNSGTGGSSTTTSTADSSSSTVGSAGAADSTDRKNDGRKNSLVGRVSGRHMARLLADDLRNRGEGDLKFAKRDT